MGCEGGIFRARRLLDCGQRRQGGSSRGHSGEWRQCGQGSKHEGGAHYSHDDFWLC